MGQRVDLLDFAFIAFGDIGGNGKSCVGNLITKTEIA